MDPASAAVAFVGFTASLATLAGLAVDSLKTLHKLHEKIRDAPQEITRLERDLRLFQSLILVIQKEQCSNGDSTISQPLCELWKCSRGQLQQDIEILKTFLLDLDRYFGQNSISSKNIRARIGFFFKEEKVAEIQRRLSMNIQFLNSVECLMSLERLNNLSIATTELRDLTKTSFNGVCTKVDEIGLAIQGQHDIQQSTLGRLESHLETMQNHLEPISSQLATVTNWNMPATRCKSRSSAENVICSTTDYETQLYKLPIGNLQVFVSEEYKRSSAMASSKGTRRTKINIIFIPPRFLSNTVLQSQFELRQDAQHSMLNSHSITCSLTPISVNYNTALCKALLNLDVGHMQHLFAIGQARPIDHIFLPEYFGERPLALLEASLSMFVNIIPCFSMLSRHMIFLKFLLDQGAATSMEYIVGFFYHPYASMWLNDRPGSNKIFATYIEYLSTRKDISLRKTKIPNERLSLDGFLQDGQISLLSTLVRTGVGSKAISKCLFSRNVQWEIEDLTMVDKWLISVLAYTDKDFLRMFKRHLGSHKSPFTNAGCSTADHIFKSFFDIDVVIDQVKDSKICSRLRFLKLVVIMGNLSMLKPFIDARIEVNEGIEYEVNLLGIAAVKGKQDIVQALLDAGTNGGLALTYFLDHSQELTGSRFHEMLSLLVGSISPVRFPANLILYSDPLGSLLSSGPGYSAYPQVVEILLDNGLWTQRSLYGSKDLFLCHSHLYRAIINDRPRAIELFLERGVDGNSQIEFIFDCNRPRYQKAKLCTWLTLTAEYGRAECAEVLIRYGAKITTPDGSGKSAIEIARINVNREHPRTPSDTQEYESTEVSFAQDAKTLAVLEEAFLALNLNQKPRKKSLKSFLDIRDYMAYFTRHLQRLPHIRHFEDFTKYFSSTSIGDLRKSLQTVTLVCLSYVAVYIILVFFETHAIISWLMQLPNPSRTLFLIFLIMFIAGKGWGDCGFGQYSTRYYVLEIREDIKVLFKISREGEKP